MRASPPLAATRSRVLRELLALELLDEVVAADVAQRDEQQGKVAGPDDGAERDARHLEAADDVERGLALAREDVEHAAHEDPRLCADRGFPEPEQRPVASQEKRGEEAQQDQCRDGGVDEK